MGEAIKIGGGGGRINNTYLSNEKYCSLNDEKIKANTAVALSSYSNDIKNNKITLHDCTRYYNFTEYSGGGVCIEKLNESAFVMVWDIGGKIQVVIGKISPTNPSTITYTAKFIISTESLGNFVTVCRINDTDFIVAHQQSLNYYTHFHLCRYNGETVTVIDTLTSNINIGYAPQTLSYIYDKNKIYVSAVTFYRVISVSSNSLSFLVEKSNYPSFSTSYTVVNTKVLYCFGNVYIPLQGGILIAKLENDNTLTLSKILNIAFTLHIWLSTDYYKNIYAQTRNTDNYSGLYKIDYKTLTSTGIKPYNSSYPISTYSLPNENIYPIFLSDNMLFTIFPQSGVITVVSFEGGVSDPISPRSKDDPDYTWTGNPRCAFIRIKDYIYIFVFSYRGGSYDIPFCSVKRVHCRNGLTLDGDNWIGINKNKTTKNDYSALFLFKGGN